MAPSRKAWDDWFPTLVRYVGVAMLIFYAVASAFGIRIPESVLIAGTGMTLYKTVSEGVKNGGNGSGNGGKNGHS